jgi:hypothetical protein
MSPESDEAMRHMLEFLGWLLNCCDYQLHPNVMTSVTRWAAEHSGNGHAATGCT